MRFATFPLGEAQGAILVHGVRAGGRVFKKGRVLSQADLDALREAGIADITAVKLEPGDIAEDIAATRIARALAGKGTRVGAAFTGRANLYAETAGLVVLDSGVIDKINLIDESVTIATLSPFAAVAPGDMVATIKIVPFAAPERAVAAAVEAAAASLIGIAAFKPMKVALVSTQLPGQKPSLLDKNRSALEARLAQVGGALVSESRVAHADDAVAEGLRVGETAGAELLFVFGASAITDRRDVIPAGIVAAGGAVTHFGMPVDPGNLLLLGDLHGKPVVGLPSCARSPKVNGFDFVMQRLFAGLSVTGKDIMRMGVGGLLQEIPTRPQPRDVEHVPQRAPRIAGIVLAAGLSTRMGTNKLLADWRGKPLIRSTVEATLKSEARPVIVVTGHQAGKIESALQGLPVTFAPNPDYADGLSTSLKAGLRAVPANCDGALVLLGDMPRIAPSLVDRMIAAFSPADGRAICIAVHEHKRGNPVLWARRFFPEIEQVSGDTGAKPLLARHEELVCEIEAGPSSLSDVDTPEALAELRASAEREPIP
jgi:molybdenum cofactor cytidylyltransferase